MNAFISYSHNDSEMLDMLHKHLAQLKREGILKDWTDQNILAGGNLNNQINSALIGASVFIALISPDYIASNYCYEKEFQKALELEQQKKIIIIPVILEPCDWLNTPFSQFKAIPKDGKAVTLWENKNNAFLDIIQNIRKIIEFSKKLIPEIKTIPSIFTDNTRNYRVKRDFDSIEKIEFIEKTFTEVKEFLKRYIEELIQQIDNVNSKVLIDNNNQFHCLLVNRNKIATEAHMNFFLNSENKSFNNFRNSQKELNYSIDTLERGNTPNKGFTLSHDEFALFWTQNDIYSFNQKSRTLTSKDIADTIWEESLQTIGIIF